MRLENHHQRNLKEEMGTMKKLKWLRKPAKWVKKAAKKALPKVRKVAKGATVAVPLLEVLTGKPK